MPSKDLERAVLEMCQATVPGFPNGSAKDNESPDFLVRAGDKTIGIEMQEFILGATAAGAPAREADSNRIAVMQVAQKEFEASHPDLFLYVHAGWKEGANPDRKAVPALGHLVAALAETLVPSPPRSRHRMSERQATYEELEEGGLSEQLGYLRVSRYRPATYGLWAVPEWGMASVDLADLSRQIAAKELKVLTYRQSCDEVWLVIYGLAHISGTFDVEILRGFHVTTSFDQVVFLDAVSREYELLAG